MQRTREISNGGSSHVVFIKDGQIYTQLNKGEESRNTFLKDIMKTLS